jgi:hypothetical protein
MYHSRLGRYQEKILTKRLILSIIGSIAIVVFLVVFGLKILINFSLVVDKIRGKSATPSLAPAFIQPPILDSLPSATNSAVLTVSGTGEAKLTVILFINEKQTKSVTVDDNGIFRIRDVVADEGQNTISAKLVDDQGNKSELSNVMTVFISKKEPLLEITTPVDGTSMSGDNTVVIVSGKTDPDNAVTVNNRFAVVQQDGSFTFTYVLSEGENILTIEATNVAGNKIKVERKVTYQK